MIVKLLHSSFWSLMAWNILLATRVMIAKLFESRLPSKGQEQLFLEKRTQRSAMPI